MSAQSALKLAVISVACLSMTACSILDRNRSARAAEEALEIAAPHSRHRLSRRLIRFTQSTHARSLSQRTPPTGTVAGARNWNRTIAAMDAESVLGLVLRATC